MRVLGLDIGDRRVGIALSDETGTIASPHGVYTRRSPGEDVHHLAQLAREAGAVALVVGLPLHMDGTEGEQVAKTRALAEAVARDAGLPDLGRGRPGNGRGRAVPKGPQGAVRHAVRRAHPPGVARPRDTNLAFVGKTRWPRATQAVQ